MQQTQYPPSQRWIPPLFRYIHQHLWDDNELAADIWNGRWSPTMFRSAIGPLADIPITKQDAQVGRNCLRTLSTTLLQLQQLIFKARTRLLSERTHGHRRQNSRQLKLPHITRPTPTPRPPKRFRSPSPTPTPTTTPWLKRTRSSLSTPSRFSSLTHPPPPPLLPPSPHPPPITLAPHPSPVLWLQTPQPPLLTTPQWTALQTRHRPHPPDTPYSSPSTANLGLPSRKRLRHSALPSPPTPGTPQPPPHLDPTLHCAPRHPPTELLTASHLSSPSTPQPPGTLRNPSPSTTSHNHLDPPHPRPPLNPTRIKRPRLRAPLSLPRMLLPHTNHPHPRRTTTHPPRAQPPNMNIDDQPPLLTSTYWRNLQTRQRPPPHSGEGRS
jgi:hypothetical protein